MDAYTPKVYARPTPRVITVAGVARQVTTPVYAWPKAPEPWAYLCVDGEVLDKHPGTTTWTDEEITERVEARWHRPQLIHITHAEPLKARARAA